MCLFVCVGGCLLCVFVCLVLCVSVRVWLRVFVVCVWCWGYCCWWSLLYDVVCLVCGVGRWCVPCVVVFCCVVVGGYCLLFVGCCVSVVVCWLPCVVNCMLSVV